MTTPEITLESLSNLEIQHDRSWEPEALQGLPLPSKASDWCVAITSAFGMVVMPNPLKVKPPTVSSPFSEESTDSVRLEYECAPVASRWVALHPFSFWAVTQTANGMPSLTLIAQDIHGRMDRPFLFDLSTVGGVFELDPIQIGMLVARFEGQPPTPSKDPENYPDHPGTKKMSDIVQAIFEKQLKYLNATVTSARSKIITP